MEEDVARRRRINRLKKMILATVGLSILIPIIVCIFLGIKVFSLSARLSALQASLSEEIMKNMQNEENVFSTSLVEESSRSQEDAETETTVDLSEITGEDSMEGVRKIYLTFDDGPSSRTNDILDILKAYDVKATFFVVGKTDPKSQEAYRRIVEEGHTLAMHSYSHKYNEIYASKESFIEDLTNLQEYLYDITGVWPRFYRFPGGSSNSVSRIDMQELIRWLEENNIRYFDWNVSSGDAVAEMLPKNEILQNCLLGIKGQEESVILFHDAAEKKTTVDALAEFITTVRLKGNAEFAAITDETEPIQHIKPKKINEETNKEEINEEETNKTEENDPKEGN